MNLKSRHNTYIVGCPCKYHHRTDEVEMRRDLEDDPGRGLHGEVFFVCPASGKIESGLVYRGG